MCVQVLAADKSQRSEEMGVADVGRGAGGRGRIRKSYLSSRDSKPTAVQAGQPSHQATTQSSGRGGGRGGKQTL